MTKADKELLLNFITRISMWIHPQEAASVVNFIHGYEAGTKNKCDFTTLVRQLLSEKYKTDYSSDGWPGQIKRLAKRRHSTWLIIFRKVTLEIIVSSEGGSLNETQQALLKKAIVSRIEHVAPTGPPWLSDTWVADWLSICSIKSNWFKQLWTRKEWTIIRAMDKLVQTGNIFSVQGESLPSAALVELKEAYSKAAGES